MAESKPGDGIKSLKTSNAFKIINFELYTTPVSILSYVLFNSITYLMKIIVVFFLF